jgi:dTDP-4-amino-4,6-dideoxygalactose transaminase
MLPGLLRKGAVAQSLVVELPGTIDRGAFLEALGREGVEATVASYALHRLPALRAHCGGDERYPVATRLHEQGVTLPLFPALEREAVAEVARVVEALVRRST